jgi:hypothetical protein
MGGRAGYLISGGAGDVVVLVGVERRGAGVTEN